MTSATQKGQVYLEITDPSGRVKFHGLTEENSMLIGSGSNTLLRLRDPEIASVHCLVRFSQGVVAIDDWCSATGTFVNGQRIEGETTLNEGDTVSIGSCKIGFSFSAPRGAGETHKVSETPDYEPPPEAPIQVSDAVEQVADIEAIDIECDSSTVSIDEPSAVTTPKTTTPEADVLSPETKEPESSPQASWDSWFTEDDSASDAPSESKSLSLEEETIQLLNLEISGLQAELETQKNYIAELESNRQTPDGRQVGAGDSDNLEQRLQDLLAELDRCDQRTTTLEDLLHLSDDAAQAEKQERQQIESWVADIESRISGREAEWQAEKEELQKHVEQLKNDRIRIEESLNAADSSGNVEAQERAIAELRKECSDLEDRLADSEEQRTELRSQLDSTDMQTMIERQQQVVEEAVREEQLAIARERAEFSRTKADLLRRVADLEADLRDRKRPVSEGDARFNAFRDHLREINEKPVPAAQAVPLTKRLVSLWNRLEYGPTDTE